jgi:hypothetical protein
MVFVVSARLKPDTENKYLVVPLPYQVRYYLLGFRIRIWSGMELFVRY